MFKTLWSTLGHRARIGLIGGVVAIVGLTITLAAWALRTHYEVLFSDLSPHDAAAMTAELDQMKLPYQIGADGTSILVDRHAVHETRLKLMGKELPLHGAVGFELFNTADFGMTEFAQKVNYQRALQGELTRTIQSIAEVESVRVHLAFPEEGLFKRNEAKAKASITLGMKHGLALRREQVAGIQRLVAAAVPGIQSDDVTIVSQEGIALTHSASEEVTASTSLRLELKRDVEQQLAQKANAVLEKAFGVGQALASVDVTLDMNQVRVTTEDVTTPAAAPGEAPMGVVIRERETVRDSGAPQVASDGVESIPGNMHRETEYQVGRRVEQVVSSPGAISRLHALAILKAPLSAEQIEQVKAVLASAVGVSRERGDTVVVQPLGGLAAVVAAPASPPLAANRHDIARAETDARIDRNAESAPGSLGLWVSVLLGGLVVAAAAAWRWARRLRPVATRASVPTLSLAERQASLAQIQSWLQEPAHIGTDRKVRS